MIDSIYTDQGQSSSLLNEGFINKKNLTIVEEELPVSFLDAGYLYSIVL
jgi:hypothetical protein